LPQRHHRPRDLPGLGVSLQGSREAIEPFAIKTLAPGWCGFKSG
jgi:hypothetical protein